MPMIKPPARVSQNERNEPISAAANAGMTIRIMLSTWRTETMLAVRTAARTPSIDPSAQLSAAILSAERPIAALARRLSATEDVDRPNLVKRNSAQHPAV